MISAGAFHSIFPGMARTQPEGVGASAYASSPAPSGYHWEFVTSNGEQVTSGGIPVVDLVRN